MTQDQLEHAALLREAFEEYLEHLYDQPPQHGKNLLSYDFDFLKARKWHGLAEAMLSCDLRELTNLINRWNSSLGRWHAWSLVLERRNELEAWELRHEFLDSLARECLLMPSSIRDTLTSVATAAFHQVRLSNEPSYSDILMGDQKTPEEKTKWLNRRQKEKRLSTVVEIWPESAHFLNALREINTPEYTKATSNYRNLTSHSIGPRLGLGQVRTVTRLVEPALKLEEVESGGFVQVNVPGKMTVSYGYGGTLPLDLEIVRSANLVQYQKARSCFAHYFKLLEATVAKIPSVENVS